MTRDDPATSALLRPSPPTTGAKERSTRDDALDYAYPSTARIPPFSRVEAIDYAKGVGILLVVLGHVWRGLDGRVPLPQPAFAAMDRWVYGFHMPLFFFVSGLFLYRSANKPAGTYLADKASTILWPYLLWSIIYWRLGSLTGTPPLSAHTFALSLVAKPIGHLWFLWILLWIAIVMLALRKLRIPAWGTLAIAVVICMAAKRGMHLRVADWIHLPIDGPLYQFAMFFPYVAAAATVAGPLLNAFARTPLWAWAIAAVVGASVVTFETRSGPSDALMFDFTSGAAGVVMVLALARFLEHDRLTSFRFLGQRSLEIYLLHILFAAAARTLLSKGLNVQQWWVHLPLGLTAGILGPLAVWYLCERCRFPYPFRLSPSARREKLDSIPAA